MFHEIQIKQKSSVNPDIREKMNKRILIFAPFLLQIFLLNAQSIKTLKVNKAYSGFHISEGEKAKYAISFKKGQYYTLVVMQQGIDVELFLQDKNGVVLQQKDSPNGMYGPEKMVYAPDSTVTCTLVVAPFVEAGNSMKGNYSITIRKAPKSLERLKYDALCEDFDILKNAFLETKIGLWYNTYPEFDSFCAVQKSKIRPSMNALELYQVLAPLVAFTKEGHSNIRVSDQVKVFLQQNARYFPFRVKIFQGNCFLLNNLGEFKTQGMMLTKINGKRIEAILDQFLQIEPADGYNLTSKYDWIEGAFSKYYMLFFEQMPRDFEIEVQQPQTGMKTIYREVPAYGYKSILKYFKELKESLPVDDFTEPVTFRIDSETQTAVLTVNSFSSSNYDDGRQGFKQYLQKKFKQIIDAKLPNLIIDLRRNEGGDQGMEDHLLSYLIDSAYAKYSYVEIPGFTYSCIPYTDYKSNPGELVDELKEDFFRGEDGRFLNIPGHYQGDAPGRFHFKGEVYILINGLTFSGGSEFAALAKNYTNATFIGEETGGGYYGNSSGYFLQYTLPNSQLTGRIPLCKFVPDVKDFGIPFGRGLMPDHVVQATIDDYFSGRDPELEFAFKLIKR
ncbi:MAG TPA: hypothetical protein ENJ82_06865 [Bacteroidetes bacterium]|nr:hypothetical protein [Bacteroidota bacterium]